MSSSDNTCVEECCQDCTRSLCQGCADSCTVNCEESCNQACSDSCSNACSNSCSSSSCSCGSSPGIAIFPLVFAFAGTFLGSILLGLVQAFDSQGPILITLFGSTFLALSLSGIRINKSHTSQTCNPLKLNSAKSFSTKFGCISINHSHHPLPLIKTGHEFKFHDKYFCTGCYGILLGTIFSILIGSYYVVSGFSSLWIRVLPLIIPLCLIPIILRYLLRYRTPSSLKFFANSLLPVGCCLFLIYTDILYHNWVFNVIAVLLIISGAFTRSIIAEKDNKIKE